MARYQNIQKDILSGVPQGYVLGQIVFVNFSSVIILVWEGMNINYLRNDLD